MKIWGRGRDIGRIRRRETILKAPIDVQADVSGFVLIPISVSSTHIQFHFSCFKSWYRADMASPLSDAEISHVYLMNAKRNRMQIWRHRRSNFRLTEAVKLALAGCPAAWSSAHFWLADEPIDGQVHIRFGQTDPTTRVYGGLNKKKQDEKMQQVGEKEGEKRMIKKEEIHNAKKKK